MKYFLCIPGGGLNDNLVQISKCYDVCLKSKNTRKLLLSENYSYGLLGYFSKIFDVQSFSVPIECIDLNNPQSIKELISTSHSFYPNTLNKANFHLLAELSCNRQKGESMKWEIPGTGNCLKYNFTQRKKYLSFLQRYNRDMLVHASSGGGVPHTSFLRELRFTKQFTEDILPELSILPHKFIAVHIRNGDVNSIHWRNYLSKVASDNQRSNIVICSDDREVLEEAGSLMPGCNIVIYEDKVDPFADGDLIRRQHVFTHTKASDFKKLRRQMRDLITLSLAEKILTPTVVDRKGKKFISGFSRLAYILKQDNFQIREQFISR